MPSRKARRAAGCRGSGGGRGGGAPVGTDFSPIRGGRGASPFRSPQMVCPQNAALPFPIDCLLLSWREARVIIRFRLFLGFKGKGLGFRLGHGRLLRMATLISATAC